MARIKNRLGNGCEWGGGADHQRGSALVGLRGLIDGRVKSLGDDDEERCVK